MTGDPERLGRKRPGVSSTGGGAVRFGDTGPDIQWYTEVAADFQNATQSYHVI